MDETQNIFDEYLFSGDLREGSLSVSLSGLKSNVPRINLKKIKLSKDSDLDSLLREKNITKVYLDDALFSLAISKHIGGREEKKVDLASVILRKKGQKPGKEKQVTFNMEAHAASKEENVIYSPSDVSMPPLKEDIVSSSGEGEKLAWPPKEKEGGKKEEGKKEGGKKEGGKTEEEKKVEGKKKPYYLSLPSEQGEEKEEEKKEPSQQQAFPWTKSNESYEGLDTLFQGGLESELLGTEEAIPTGEKLPQDLDLEKGLEPKLEETVPESKQKPPEKISVFALQPNIQVDAISSKAAKDKIQDKDDKLKGKEKSMFNLTPIRIIIIGGAVATLSYLLTTYYENYFGGGSSTGTKVKISNVFKKNHIKKKSLDVKKSNEEAEEFSSKLAFKPITEKERLALIEKARQAIESRVDPFGFEAFFPKITEKEKKLAKAKEKGEVALQRKQVELVGVISAANKNLALVNVYTADYTVKVDDDSKTREAALKAALGMSVPNRLEVSILDPVEDWFVKMINRSKSRSDDPSILLVRGSQQFKLKVGEKVLLPPDQTFEEIVAEMEAKEKEEEAALEALGLNTDLEE